MTPGIEEDALDWLKACTACRVIDEAGYLSALRIEIWRIIGPIYAVDTQLDRECLSASL